MGSLKNKKYCIVEKFLTQEETKLLTDYCRLKHKRKDKTKLPLSFIFSNILVTKYEPNPITIENT